MSEAWRASYMSCPATPTERTSNPDVYHASLVFIITIHNFSSNLLVCEWKMYSHMHIASAPGASPEVHSIRSHVPSCHSTRRRIFSVRLLCVRRCLLLHTYLGSYYYDKSSSTTTCPMPMQLRTLVSSTVVRDTFSAGRPHFSLHLFFSDP